jgi:type IV pilus assembly protein PilM
MAEKILGVDIGSRSLKAVQISHGFRSALVTGYASMDLPPDADPSGVAQGLEQLISSHALTSPRTRLALGTHHAFLRRLNFPFAAERKIQQVIRFELEPTLPVGLDAVLVDFIKTRRRPDGVQEVLTAALPRGVVEPLLDALHGVGIDPEVVDLDGGALRVVADELREQLPERAVILDIGHHKTTMLHWQHGRHCYLRALPFGCERLARTVAARLELPLADGLKRLFSPDPDGSPDATVSTRIRDALAGEIEVLAHQFAMSLQAAGVHERRADTDLVVLSGGGALIQGVRPHLEKTLELPVSCIGDLHGGGVFDQLEDQSRDAPVFAVAAGLALTGARRSSGFNFRGEEFRSKTLLSRWRQHLVYALVAGLLVAFSRLGSLGVDIYAKTTRLAQLNRRIEAVFHRALPEFQDTVQQAQYPSILHGRISQLSQSLSLLHGRGRFEPVVELLRRISQTIPPSLEITIEMLTVDEQHVRISGTAAAFNTVDAVQNRLADSGYFSSVTITGAKAASEGKEVQFTLEVLRPPLLGERP